jgi:plastocyanin
MSMRDYLFNGNNPTLTFRPGERVRFVIRNEESAPIRHNFEIPELGVACGADLGPGESREVTVTMPRSGSFAYGCCTHRGMGGKLTIVRR